MSLELWWMLNWALFFTCLWKHPEIHKEKSAHRRIFWLHRWADFLLLWCPLDILLNLLHNLLCSSASSQVLLSSQLSDSGGWWDSQNAAEHGNPQPMSCHHLHLWLVWLENNNCTFSLTNCDISLKHFLSYFFLCKSRLNLHFQVMPWKHKMMQNILKHDKQQVHFWQLDLNCYLQCCERVFFKLFTVCQGPTTNTVFRYFIEILCKWPTQSSTYLHI